MCHPNAFLISQQRHTKWKGGAREIIKKRRQLNYTKLMCKGLPLLKWYDFGQQNILRVSRSNQLKTLLLFCRTKKCPARKFPVASRITPETACPPSRYAYLLRIPLRHSHLLSSSVLHYVLDKRWQGPSGVPAVHYTPRAITRQSCYYIKRKRVTTQSWLCRWI